MYEEPRFGTMYGVPQTSYVPKSTVSEESGDYKLTESNTNTYIPNIPDYQQTVYFTDIDGEANGLYKDTVVVVDFEDAEQTKKGKSWYEGEFTVTKDIELKKHENE
jgi:putative lipoprotein (rSAM/lipoprotein system)